MTTPKERLTKSLAMLSKEVEDVAVLAKSQRQNADKQHDNADKQHENAHRLEVIGAALDASAVGLKAELKKI